MLFNFHLPHYFANKVRSQVEHLYFAVGIGNLAQSIVALFEPIFLFAVVGMTIEEILLFVAAVYAIYIFTIPWGAKIASRYGYAHTLFFSIPFTILFWLTLYGAKDNQMMLFPAMFFLAIQKSLFWPAFHTSLARFANGGQVAREFSMAYSIMNFVQIIGPFLGGVIAVYFGIGATFVVASIIYLFAAIPLFWSKEVFTPKEYTFKGTWELYKQYPKHFFGYLGYGEELLALIVWPIFIYTIVDNFEQLGLMITVSTLVATAFALLIGIFTDSHSKRLTLRVGAFFTSLIWLARIPVASAFGVIVTDSLARTSKSIVTIPMTALTYERAESTHIMHYVVGYEQALSIGKLLAALLGIIVFGLTGSFAAVFLLCAIIALMFLLL